MSNIIIRNIKENEVDDLVILCELHAKYENCTYDKSNKAIKLKEALFTANASLICIIAVHNNKLVGYSSFLKEYSTWDADYFLYMDCLYVLEEYRNNGLGKKLFDEVINYKNKLNCSHIQWQTPNDNIKAINFYKKIGAISKNKERFFYKGK